MPGGQSLVDGGLGLELGAQPPGVAGGAAHPPLGALGAAGGPGQREHALGGALRLGVAEPLAAASPAAACRLARSASSQAAACRGVDTGGALAGGRPGGAGPSPANHEGMCWPAARAVCR